MPTAFQAELIVKTCRMALRLRRSVHKYINACILRFTAVTKGGVMIYAFDFEPPRGPLGLMSTKELDVKQTLKEIFAMYSQAPGFTPYAITLFKDNKPVWRWTQNDRLNDILLQRDPVGGVARNDAPGPGGYTVVAN